MSAASLYAADYKQYRDNNGNPVVSVFAYVPPDVAQEWNDYCRSTGQIVFWDYSQGSEYTTMHLYYTLERYHLAINVDGYSSVYLISRNLAQYITNFLLLRY